jgi:hypothetical protein
VHHSPPRQTLAQQALSHSFAHLVPPGHTHDWLPPWVWQQPGSLFAAVPCRSWPHRPPRHICQLPAVEGACASAMPGDVCPPEQPAHPRWAILCPGARVLGLQPSALSFFEILQPANKVVSSFETLPHRTCSYISLPTPHLAGGLAQPSS